MCRPFCSVPVVDTCDTGLSAGFLFVAVSWTMLELLSEYGAQVIPVLLAFAAYFLGLRAFHVQKEYELIRQRSLNEGLDAVAEDVEHALIVERQIFQRAFTVLRQFREAGEGIRPTLLEEGSAKLDIERFKTIVSYRVQTLTGSSVFWDGVQLLYARVQQFVDFFNDELIHTISKIVSGTLEPLMPREQFQEISVHAVTTYHESIQDDFHKLLSLLQRLTTELESRRFNLRTIHRFKKRRRVRCIVENAKALLKQITERPRPEAIIQASIEQRFAGNAK
jgi:hypothetical protein